MLEDKEIIEWLEEVCKEEPYKSAKDLSIVMPMSCGEIIVLKEPEKWKDKEVHFFGSSFVDEGKLFARNFIKEDE